MPLLLIPVLVVLSVIVLIPIGIVRRYQVGTSRQRARGWLAALNLFGLMVSILLFVSAAAVTSIWVPGILLYVAGGLGGGALLGLLGLMLTRWEPGPDELHYTPNRLLVLGITLLVTARVLYGFWRAWESWRAGLAGESWFVEAGLPGAMAAGAVVLGYYGAFWLGVRRRLRQHAGRRIRRL
jgi:hypothetical protein